LCGEWGSIGRAVQVAVEIMVEQGNIQGSGLSSAEERSQGLKVPFSFSVLDRTDKQIKWLAQPESYGNRNQVISACEGVLADLHVRESIGSQKR
jgi:hypothetical protein